MATARKFTLLLYDASWGRTIFRLPENDPLYQVTNDWSALPRADVVLFHVPTAPNPLHTRKYPGQIWVAYSMENDVFYPKLKNAEYMAPFDLRMTYRWDSDIPLMYWERKWRSMLFEPPMPKTGTAEATFFASNQNEFSGRTEYVREMMQYMKVDCYGRVFRNQELADGRGRESKLKTIARYRFNLAFENSIALDYVTEKFFDPLVTGCVPVYLGAPNIDEFAPGDHCYINAANFSRPQDLAGYLLHLANSPLEYDAYFAWKSRPLRESFLRKIEIAEKDPLRRLCDHLLERGCVPRKAAGFWNAAAWPWRRHGRMG